ncbi:MAG TPA: 4Fe-4S dicluster domain-containing protein [Chloroflexota bacterium]
MFRIIMAALRQGRTTERLEDLAGPAPATTRGRPALDADRCDGDAACAAACPTTALTMGPPEADGRRILTLDYGACIFCGRCAAACAQGALSMTTDYTMAVRKREDLVLSARVPIGIWREVE